jgi:hypothetical protein
LSTTDKRDLASFAVEASTAVKVYKWPWKVLVGLPAASVYFPLKSNSKVETGVSSTIGTKRACFSCRFPTGQSGQIGKNFRIFSVVTEGSRSLIDGFALKGQHLDDREHNAKN